MSVQEDMHANIVISICHDVYHESHESHEDSKQIFQKSIKNLTDTDKQQIICHYGIMKAFAKFQESRIALGETPQDICEYYKGANTACVASIVLDSMIRIILDEEMHHIQM